MISTAVCIGLLVTLLVVSSLAVSGTWRVSTSQMTQPRSDHTVSRVGTLLYLIGGCTGDQPEGSDCTSITDSIKVILHWSGFSPIQIEEFVPLFNANNVVSGAFRSLARMPRPRFRHTSSVIGTKIVVIGGRDLADNLIPEIDVYDTATNTWTTLSVPVVWNVSDHSAFVHNEIAYIAGGYDVEYRSLGAMASFDLSTLTWRTAGLPSLNSARGDLSIEVINEKAYAVGGFSDENFCSPLRVVEEYNPGTNLWTLKASMHLNRGDKASAVLNGQMFVMGGEQKNDPVNCTYSVPVLDVESYSPLSNSWTDQRAILESKFRFDAEELNGRVYIFGGQQKLSENVHTVSTTFEVLSVDNSGLSPSSDAGSNSLSTLMHLLLSSSIFVIQNMRN